MMMMITNKCKHGLTPDTCGMCKGLVKTVGELELLWIDFVDVEYDALFDKRRVNERPDKHIWMKQHKYALKKRFFKKWGQYPPI